MILSYVKMTCFLQEEKITVAMGYMLLLLL